MNNQNNDSFPLLNLPNEVLRMVIEHYDEVDLPELIRTNRFMHQETLPVLYRRVDLSTLHPRFRGESARTFRPLLALIPPPHQEDLRGDGLTHRLDINRWGSAQDNFIRTLIAKPDLARLIKTFSWTWFPIDLLLRVLPSWTEQDIWRVLLRLENVKTLDFTVCTAHQAPLRLFPAVINPRLAGSMPHSLAISILRSLEPSNLKSLELHDLQDQGWDVDWFQNDGTDGPTACVPSSQRREIHPKPMPNLLGGLEGHCVSLETLILRKRGYAIQPDHTPVENEMDEAIYREWADFTISVKSTLRKLVFEHIYYTGELTTHRQDQDIQSMDERFMRIVYPILSGDWPHLESLEIRGVRHYADWLGPNVTLESALKKILGPRVAIHVDENPERQGLIFRQIA